MNLRIALLAVLLWMVAGCSSGAGQRMAMPTQDLTVDPPPGTARAIFFNPEGRLSNDITVEVDGNSLPKLNSKEYAQIFVAPGGSTSLCCITGTSSGSPTSSPSQ